MILRSAPWVVLLGTTLSAQSLPLESRDVPFGRGGGTRAVDFGRIDVPEVRGKPGSRKIQVAFVRARSKRHSGPPVFVLAGGPGGSSIRQVLGMLRGGGERLFDVMGGDVVGIDQRGVGESLPNLDSKTRIPIPIATPGEPRALLKLIRKVCREEASRWRKKGVDPAGYTTAESVADMDAVRRALGYAKITLFGGSYGSHLGMAMIRAHGDKVARAMLSGPEGPDHTVKLPSYAQEGLERLARLVAKDPRLGEKIPDLVALVRRVLDRLAKAPVVVAVEGQKVGISKFDVQNWLANKIGTRRQAEEVPAEILQMANGDFSRMAKTFLAERRGWTIRTAMQWLMDSASGLSKRRAALIEAEAKDCLLGDTVNFPFPHVAQAWGAKDLGREFRGPLVSKVPILFIVGELDSRTPIRNAKELMPNLPNAHLLTVTNVGHDSPLGIPDVRKAWSGFLQGKPVTLTRVQAPPLRFKTIAELGKKDFGR